jgi:LacI family transcriptional regulator
MGRPTIKDLSQASGVSVATVNRVLAGSAGVRPAMMQRVKEAAQEIGFYGVGAIQSRISAARPKYRFGFLLHQPTRTFYQDIATALRAAAGRVTDCDVSIRVEFLEDLSPQNIVERMRGLAENCDSIGVVAAVHPLVTQAVSELQQQGLPVFGLVSQLAATGHVHYVGLDNWKVGRMAAWTFEKICRKPGKLAILVGNHRYRCQEMNEAGFRSYFRELAPEFTLLEPQSTFESSAIAQELVEKLVRDVPDLSGIYVAGGGITGVITALRHNARPEQLVVVGYQLMDVTRKALLDGYMTLAISHPLDLLAEKTIIGMIHVRKAPESGSFTSILPFEIHTRENI